MESYSLDIGILKYLIIYIVYRSNMNVNNMDIPKSIRKELSEKLIGVILDSESKNVPQELAKRVIYLWRQDQLTTDVGISTLLEVANLTDVEATHGCLETFGLQGIEVYNE